MKIVEHERERTYSGCFLQRRGHRAEESKALVLELTSARGRAGHFGFRSLGNLNRAQMADLAPAHDFLAAAYDFATIFTPAVDSVGSSGKRRENRINVVGPRYRLDCLNPWPVGRRSGAFPAPTPQHLHGKCGRY